MIQTKVSQKCAYRGCMMRFVEVFLVVIVLSAAQAQVLNCLDGYVKNIENGPIHGRLGFRGHMDIPAVDGVENVRLVRYPSDTTNFQRPITSLQILDQIGDGSGGCAKVAFGGSGFNFVLIEYRSHIGKHLDYSVALYLTE